MRAAAWVNGRLARADSRDQLVGGIVQADVGKGPADLHLAELRVAEALPAAEDAPLVLLAVELGERQQVVAREPAVVVDEGLLALDAQPREQIPQLARVRDRAARVIDEVGEVAVDRLL